MVSCLSVSSGAAMSWWNSPGSPEFDDEYLDGDELDRYFVNYLDWRRGKKVTARRNRQILDAVQFDYQDRSGADSITYETKISSARAHAEQFWIQTQENKAKSQQNLVQYGQAMAAVNSGERW